MLFALIHSDPILPELVEGGNKQVLPVFWRFCPIAKTVGGRQRPSGQAMREKRAIPGQTGPKEASARHKPAFRPAWKTTVLSRLAHSRRG